MAGVRSITFARFSREVLVELAVFALMLISIGGSVLLGGDIGPFRRKFGVQFQPLLKARFGVRQNRFGRAFGFANAAIDAFAGVDYQHVFAFVEAVDGANLDAIHEFTTDAGVSDDVGHGEFRPSVTL